MTTYISNDWTLKAFRANVRSQASALTQIAKMGGRLLLHKQLDDIIHRSIVDVRRSLHSLVHVHYRTTSAALTTPTGAKPNYSFSLSALKATPGFYSLDFDTMSLYDDVLQNIPLLPRDLYDDYRDLYVSTDIGTTNAFATIETDAVGIPSLLIYSDIALAPTTTKLTFLRAVKKVTPADTVDLPDTWVPLAIDFATKYVFDKFGQQPPADVMARIQAGINNIVGLRAAAEAGKAVE
jgi:hypothetical protein